MAGCITTIIFHYSEISSSSGAMKSIRKDGVLIMKVHFNLSAKISKRPSATASPIIYLFLVGRQIAKICKLPPLQKEERKTYTHNTQLKADKHQAMCHIFSRKPKVEVLISGVGLLRIFTDTSLDVTT